MTEQSKLYIGIHGSSHQEPWQQLAQRVPSLELLDIGTKHFWQEAKLNVEIMATSFIVMKFDLSPPGTDAGCYRFEEGSPFAPIVVVPPAISRKNWPTELPAWYDDSPEGYKSYYKAHGVEVDVYNWKKVLTKVQLLKQEATSELRVGFHCESIGYFKASHEEKSRAFEIAYSQFY